MLSLCLLFGAALADPFCAIIFERLSPALILTPKKIIFFYFTVPFRGKPFRVSVFTVGTIKTNGETPFFEGHQQFWCSGGYQIWGVYNTRQKNKAEKLWNSLFHFQGGAKYVAHDLNGTSTNLRNYAPEIQFEMQARNWGYFSTGLIIEKKSNTMSATVSRIQCQGPCHNL